MTVHASAEQQVARPDAQKDDPASQSATQNMAPQQQEESLAQQESSTQGQHREQQPGDTAAQIVDTAEQAVDTAEEVVDTAERVIVTTALVAGGVLLVAAGLVAAGFMRSPIEQALRRLVDRIEVVELPLALPLTIAEIIRETRANSRIMAEMRAGQPAA
jgi:hypothetical protein